MLGALRKYSQSVIIYVLFGIIIVVFVFTFNMGSQDVGCAGKSSASSETVLAKVGDVEVDPSMLHMGLALSVDPPGPGSEMDPKAFQAELAYRTTRFARFRGDPKFQMYYPAPVSTLKARKVMDDLEETLLVSEEAMKNGLRVAPEEVRDRIVADFTDGTSGQFRKKAYEDYVRYGLRTSLARFEDFVRREILREKMIGLVTANVDVSDRELRYTATSRKAQRTYEYLEVNPTALAEALKPTPEQVAAFLKDKEADARKSFDEHKAEWQIEPGFDFRVAKFQGASRRILALVQDAEQRKGLEQSRNEAKKRAEEAAKSLQGKSGADLVAAFETVVKASDDAEELKAVGGKVQKPLPPKDIESQFDGALVGALAKMKAGEASGVLEADDGFYVVLSEGQTPGQERTFDQVKDLVAAKLVAQQLSAAEAARVAADAQARVAANPGKALADIAAEVNAAFAPGAPVKTGETGPVGGLPQNLMGLRDWNANAVPGIGESPELATALRALTPEKPAAAQPFAVGGSQYVVRLKAGAAATEVTDADLATVREELLPLKRQAFWREWYASLKARYVGKEQLVERQGFQAMVQEEARARDEAMQQRLKGKLKSLAPSAQ